MRKFQLSIPASSANLGPGFDVLGCSLSLFLVLDVSTPTSSTILTYSGLGAVPLDPTQNLITKIATYIANAHDRKLPEYHLHVINPIPLGRGLGSSGSAVVAGIALANQLLSLDLPIASILDYAVLIEGHPDNIAASLLGGWVISYMSCPLPVWRDEWFIAGEKVPTPESILKSHGLEGRITISTKLTVNPLIKAIVVIPRFELSTALARSVLSDTYSRSDVVFNLGRLTSLTHALISPTIVPNTISQSMQDKIHQTYRQHLVPGLSSILSMTPTKSAGICLSGAGPTVLALATENLAEIGLEIQGYFTANGIESDAMILEFTTTGLEVTEQ